MEKEKGSALIIVLIISIILISLTAYTIKLSKEIVKQYEDFLDKLQTKIDAKSTLEILKFTISVSSFESNYINNMSRKNFLPKKIYLTGQPIKTKLATIKLYDTSSKINALYLDRNYLRKLYSMEKIDRKQADIAYDSYLDWKDEDNLKHVNGAEEYFYKFEKGYKYGPRNNEALQDKEELKIIRGFDKNYEKIKDNLIFAYRGGLLNINTATVKTLSILLDIPIDQAKQLIKLRNRKGIITPSDIENITKKNIEAFFDIYSIYPSKVLVIEISSKKGEAKEKLKAVIDFNQTEKYPYTVIKYIE